MNRSAPTPKPRLPLFVKRPAAPIVDGGEILSFLLNGKMYPKPGTIPTPTVGLEIGRGAGTREPRRDELFFSCFSGSVLVSTDAGGTLSVVASPGLGDLLS